MVGMNRSRIAFAFATAAFVASVTFPALADPVSDFGAAWAKVDNYTVTITVHETDGKNVQDRVYHYAYKKPHFAKIDVVSGPGRGSGSVWNGGDHVRGHQGGLISGIKASISITDPRALSLRGDRIDQASFQSVADDFANGKVEVPSTTATVDGVAVDLVTVDLTAGPDGVTQRVVALSEVTHLPVRRSGYAAGALVKQEDFSDLSINPGLKESDFN
jgi:outer membrane lipoprotein-sorting protein